ncbi:MAG: hypothetical protein LBC72_04295 [Spirochaetaceae bacterium]|nr:hypothetical protein [Spirochaetaceae bacterium]
MTKKDFPRIHFYDQDFVDIYDKTWAWISDFWDKSNEIKTMGGRFFSYPGAAELRQEDAIYSSFFLVYSNRIFPANTTLDIFYGKQEANGAIRWAYNLKTGDPVVSEDNPHGLGQPLFAWVEYNLYHKAANKKRIKEVLPVLDRYTTWIDDNFKAENGLYRVPIAATGMVNAPREKAAYPIDFNCMMAINALYFSKLAEILNDKDTSSRYKRQYFSLKTRIESLMWDAEDGFYYDLDADEKRVRVHTLAGYWPLLTEIPNYDKAERIIAKLQDAEYFGSAHPFPTVAIREKTFCENGGEYHGSVFPHLNFIVLKGLERYQQWALARECAIRHLYFILDSMNIDGARSKGVLWEAYLPGKEGPALPLSAEEGEGRRFPRPQYLAYAALSTICLMVENIVGLFISLPRKTVDWNIPNLEIMGVENLALKKNLITILSNKSVRGWEIHMESEKLYYFTVNILGVKRKTLPIPSGKCSMQIDKL